MESVKCHVMKLVILLGVFEVVIMDETATVEILG